MENNQYSKKDSGQAGMTECRGTGAASHCVVCPPGCCDVLPVVTLCSMLIALCFLKREPAIRVKPNNLDSMNSKRRIGASPVRQACAPASWYNLLVWNKLKDEVRDMDAPIFFVMEVIPLPDNPQRQVIDRGFARFCVHEPDPEIAVAHALSYLEHHRWQAVKMEEDPMPIQDVQLANRDIQIILARSRETGFACQIYGAPSEGTSVEMN